MTRGHFEEFAAAIVMVTDEQERTTLAKRVATLLKGYNPHFDRKRFLFACDVDE